MTDDPLDAMKARWSYIQSFLFPWMREDNDPITEALGRVVTTLDVIGLEAFVPEPPRGSRTRPTTAKTIRRRPIIPRRRASADVHARTNRGRSRSRRVSSGR